MYQDYKAKVTIEGLREGLSQMDLDMALYKALKHSDIYIVIDEILEEDD